MQAIGPVDLILQVAQPRPADTEALVIMKDTIDRIVRATLDSIHTFVHFPLPTEGNNRHSAAGRNRMIQTTDTSVNMQSMHTKISQHHHYESKETMKETHRDRRD